MTTTAEPLADQGPCDWCTHPQWSHKRGKGGCNDLQCGGACDRYTPPKDQPAPAVEQPEVRVVVDPTRNTIDAAPPGASAHVEFARPVGFASDIEQDERDALTGRRHPTLAEVEAEPDPVDEPAAELAPVVADPAAQAEHAEQVAAIDAQLAQPDPESEACDVPGHEVGPDGVCVPADVRIERLTADRDRLSEQLMARLGDLDEAQTRIAQLEHHARILTAERNGERTANAALYRELAELESFAARERGARSAEIAQLHAELNRAAAARQRLQDQLDQAVHTGLAAAMRVLWQYDADQCLTDGCGFRTTVPGLAHQHPLTPVTVLVVEREVTE